MDEIQGMTEQQALALQKARQRVIESIGKNMDLYGITLSIGHLYGNMYFSSNPVTLDDMGQTMGMSKTSMSTGMRTLTDLKMVHKVWGKGSRKDLYEAELDWYQTFVDYFSIKWRRSAEQNMNALKKSLKEIHQLQEECSDNDPVVNILAQDTEKIKNALAYYRWLGRLIDSFESGDIFDFIPREDSE